MNALSIVTGLLEDDEDPELYLKNRLDTWDKHPLQIKVAKIPGGMRRAGEGYEDQWDFVYKDWLFTVSTYEDGTQIWSAHYKVPVTWDDDPPEVKKRGWRYSGGGEPVRVPKHFDPAVYLQLLKQMADKHPNVWRARHVPEMPKVQ